MRDKLNNIINTTALGVNRIVMDSEEATDLI